jgi:hypothetical protein
MRSMMVAKSFDWSRYVQLGSLAGWAGPSHKIPRGASVKLITAGLYLRKSQTVCSEGEVSSKEE